ncbi:MAG TPA: tRNA uridine-5-carboxymethylaminomethyl(34) synthesis GTPase MnmE [Gemmatimonadaceae bacterium]|nr:tRNA uridine-5-carboxymethylaminomethyl(34) synthesis GTPase MnmE [Gemmatimonadaceae bacterium]
MSARRRGPKPADAAVLAGAGTIAAIATPHGRGALALVRLTGPDAFAIARRCMTPWPLEPRRATLVTIHDPDSTERADVALATAFVAPHSFTGEDTLEVSSHGGAVAPARVLAAFVRAGARTAAPGEFTRRALLNGRIDLLQAEAIGDLIDAPTSLFHRAALGQLSGALTATITALRASLIDLEALLAYDIDFPEEDEGPLAAVRVTEAVATARHAIRELLDTLPVARIAREGAVVVFAGVPNAGKSSLFNALLGEARAIVTEHPGTTRDAIDALIDADPYPLRLVDTAGLRDALDPVERMGVEVSTQWLTRADVVLLCGPARADRDAAERAMAGSGAARIRVRTMIDRTDAVNDEPEAIAVSAARGDGLGALRDAIRRELSARYPLPRADAPLIVRARHERALTTADQELALFGEAWTARALPAPVASVHVRAAIHALDSLIGAVGVEDVLSRVFERFCVGK